MRPIVDLDDFDDIDDLNDLSKEWITEEYYFLGLQFLSEFYLLSIQLIIKNNK